MRGVGRLTSEFMGGSLLLGQEAKMLRSLAYTSFVSAALMGSGAYAADNPAPTDQSAQTQAALGVSFVTSQDMSQWRAPKLIGVGVYGPDDKQIGKIDDLLVDKNGSAKTIVIGVGGFLGFKKDVAVPFSAAVANGTAEGRGRRRSTSAVTGNPAAPGTTANQQPPMKETDPAAAEASKGYPDKAVLNVTLDELKSAPDFKYASSTLAESDMRPASGRAMKKTTP